MYKKIVTKGSTEYCYLKIRLDFDKVEPDIDALNFKQIILKAVTDLFGIAGASTLIDILRYDQSSRTAVVRIYHKFLTKLWSSLSFYGYFKELPCAFRILQVSSHLVAMATDSRSMRLQIVSDR